MGKLIYLTGPVRSGKSRLAVKLAQAWGKNVVFAATYRAGADDPEMAERLRRHRAERPTWRTLEAAPDVAAALRAMRPAPSGVVFDCLTLWLSERLHDAEHALVAQWEEQLNAFRAAPWPTIIVSNEVGWAPVPEAAEIRRFRDLAGVLGQRTAAVADEAWLLVAGCPLLLK